ncbi:hypothetical protein Q0M94_25660 (plasmid) [Deinococcus radiomollis]|uniref:hypothetical protein n=1 Tax=Deinococcus radiomollis TaxID=468916 RepID=UPI003891A761
MFLPISPGSLPAVPGSLQAYTPPRVTPLGEWTAVTLVISIPIGPGAGVFNPNPVYNGGK